MNRYQRSDGYLDAITQPNNHVDQAIAQKVPCGWRLMSEAIRFMISPSNQRARQIDDPAVIKLAASRWQIHHTSRPVDLSPTKGWNQGVDRGHNRGRVSRRGGPGLGQW
jgi:hypothetical protein